MHDLATDRAARRRWQSLGAWSIAALLLHLAALSGLDWAWPGPATAPLPTVAVQVRMVDAAAPAPVATPAAVAQAATVPPPSRHAQARPAADRGLKGTRPAPAPAVAMERPPSGDPAAPREAAPGAATAPQVATVGRAEADAVPHYRTVIAPAATLRYELRRGPLRGTGELAWRPEREHYELRLEGRIGALRVLTQISAGGFDAAGVAPERYTDQRLRRAAMAANFQRDAGKISFSGPSTEYALRPGAQDRLSWMLQLGAILVAEPQRAQAGASIVMYVVGARGDADIWIFRCVGPEVVETGAGTVDAIKFVREPRDPYDTTVQIWLDPNRHGLPVRATQKSGPTDDGFELRLLEVRIGG